MQTVFLQMSREDGGSTAIEYALIAMGIALAMIAGLNALGPSLTALFFNVANLI